MKRRFRRQSRRSIPPSGPFILRRRKLPLIVDRVGWIVDRCRDRDVLHVGCTSAPGTAQALQAGTHLHAALVPVCRRLIGIDTDLSTRALLPPDSDRHQIVKADACNPNDLAAAVAGTSYDVIVAGEVLEHLINPGLCLQSLAQLVPRATLLVTVPNCLCVQVARNAAVGTEAVHAEHVAWYSPHTLVRLLEKTGWAKTRLYAVSERHYCGRGNVRCPRLLAESTRL